MYKVENYEDEIDCIKSHVRRIRNELKIAEALAQASLLTSRAAQRRLAVRSLQIGKEPENGINYDYQPPKDVLLYLVRMGSFNSVPKIMNEDSQDNYLQLPAQMTRDELFDFCRKEKKFSTQPIRRQFEHTLNASAAVDNLLKTPGYCENKSESQSDFRVMQWNVLSQTLGQSNDNFIMCPVGALTWDFRKFNILEEILQYNPDIICLQEVDHFNFLNSLLSTQGYEGVFYPKPDSPCMYIEGNNGPDGCAIFYKKTVFRRMFTESKILEVWKVQSNQVAILMMLQSLKTGKNVFVATTHLKARSGALLSKLRNEQGKDLLDFVKHWSGDNPVIICGDFNAEPSEPVYQTILSDKSLDLGSAYANFLARNNTWDTMDFEMSAANELPYTTWKIREEGEVCHTIDYIFYSKRFLKVDGVLKAPTAEDVGEGRVPSYNYPSDHFSLVCDFNFSTAES